MQIRDPHRMVAVDMPGFDPASLGLGDGAPGHAMACVETGGHRHPVAFLHALHRDRDMQVFQAMHAMTVCRAMGIAAEFVDADRMFSAAVLEGAMTRGAAVDPLIERRGGTREDTLNLVSDCLVEAAVESARYPGFMSLTTGDAPVERDVAVVPKPLRATWILRERLDDEVFGHDRFHDAHLPELVREFLELCVTRIDGEYLLGAAASAMSRDFCELYATVPDDVRAMAEAGLFDLPPIPRSASAGTP